MNNKQIPKNILIIGTGAYGTALANILTDNNHNVIMYGINKKEINDINKYHINSKFFENIKINKNIKATNNFLEAIQNIEYIVFSAPIVSINIIIKKINKFLKKSIVFINTAKGLDPKTGNILSYTFQKLINFTVIKYFGGLYGPSIAKEIILKKPTFVIAVAKNIKIANKIKILFNNNYFIVSSNTDFIGIEYSAALKNSIAIMSGISYGLYHSDNMKASLITMGINEIKKIALIKGAKNNTFFNYACLGDLLLSTTSINSRNYFLGLEIAKQDNATLVLQNNKKTVEGVLTCKTVFNIAQIQQIKLPLFEILYNILYKNKKPSLEIINIF